MFLGKDVSKMLPGCRKIALSGYTETGNKMRPGFNEDLILGSAERRVSKDGGRSGGRVHPSFETPCCARLLGMRTVEG
jgi:hypothetical protein